MMDIKQSSADASTAALKASPPWAAVLADKFFDITLNDLVMIAALIYTILQIVVLVRNQFFRKQVATNGDD